MVDFSNSSFIDQKETRMLSVEIKTHLPGSDVGKFTQLILQAQWDSDACSRSREAITKSFVELSSCRMCVCVAEFDNKVVGVHCGADFDDMFGYSAGESVFYLSDLAVLPEYRRQGIARTLLKAIENWCRDQEWKSVVGDCKNLSRSFSLLLSEGYAPQWSSLETHSVRFQKSIHPSQ